MVFDLIIGKSDTNAIKTAFAKKRIKELLSTETFENVLVLSNNQDYEEVVPKQQIIPLNEAQSYLSTLLSTRNRSKHVLVVLDKISLTEMSNEMCRALSALASFGLTMCISTILVTNSIVPPILRASADTIYYTELSKLALRAIQDNTDALVKIESSNNEN